MLLLRLLRDEIEKWRKSEGKKTEVETKKEENEKEKRKGSGKHKEMREILWGRKEKVDGHGVAIVGASGYPLEPIPMYQKILCRCFLHPPLTISSLHTTTFWTANIPLYNTLENLNSRWCFPKIDVKDTSLLSSLFFPVAHFCIFLFSFFFTFFSFTLSSSFSLIFHFSFFMPT